MLPSGLITSIFVHVPIVEEGTQPTQPKGFRLSNYVEPKALSIAVITLLVAFCYSSVLSYINFFAIEINLVQAASFFFLFYSTAILLSRPITGRLMDVKGANYIMYPAFLIFGIGLILLSSVHTGTTLLLAGVLIGLGFGNIQSCTQAIAVKVTPSNRIGLATSTFFIFLDAGLGFGPYLLGYIIPVTGYRFLYMIMGGLVFASILLYYFLHGKKEREQMVHINTPTAV